MMLRLIIFLFLLFCIAFSYTDPPHDAVYGYNSGLPIQKNFVERSAKTTPGVDDPTTFADARILTVMPSIENRISDGNSTVFWVYGVEYKNQFSGTNSLSDERCLKGTSDLDFISYSVDPKLSFKYNNVTKEVTPGSFFVSVPFSKNELQTNEEEEMNVSINGNFTFRYHRHDVYQDYVCLGYDDEGGCDSHGCFTFVDDRNVEIKKPFYHSKSYAVENNNFTRLLVAPALREQWYRNNRFDNLIFSKRKFYDAVVKMNGVEIAHLSPYAFDIIADEYGVESIISNMSNISDFAEHSMNITPYLLQKTNHSFSYVYEFNASYDGTGNNELTLEMKDDFFNRYDINENLTSRRISFNNAVEGNSRNADVRPGITLEDKGIKPLTIGLGAIGILVIVLLANKIRN